MFNKIASYNKMTASVSKGRPVDVAYLTLGKLLILSPQHSHLASEKVWNGRNDG